MTVAKSVDLDPDLFRVTPDGDCFLVGGRCQACKAVTWGVRSMCPSCWKDGEQQEIAIGRRGTLYSATVVRHAPTGFTAPYMMGVIDLAEGIRVIGRVVPDNDGAWSKDAAVVLQAGVLGTNPAGEDVVGPMFRIVSREAS